MTCNYWDSGWCYAPNEVKTNAVQGGCFEPQFCPYLKSQMTETIQQLKEEIAILQMKLQKLEELEQTKSPVEQAFKEWYAVYPSSSEKSDFWTDNDKDIWIAFQRGYKSAEEDWKVGEFQHLNEEVPEPEELMEKLGFVKNSDGSWTAQLLVEIAEEQTKDKVPLYNRFCEEGSYGCIGFDNALKVVNEFLIDEGEIECENEEYITLTLQKSLLEYPSDNPTLL